MNSPPRTEDRDRDVPWGEDLDARIPLDPGHDPARIADLSADAVTIRP